jgi:two-component system, response regulator YesN
MRTRSSFHTFFVRFLLSYAFVLGVPIVLVLILYSASASVVERDAIESRYVLLSRIGDMVDKHLSELDELSYQLSSDAKLIELMRSSPPRNEKGEVYPFWDYMRSLTGRTTTLNDFKGSFYIILPKPNVVFTHDEAYLNIESFYGRALSFESLDYQAWRELFLSGRWKRKTLPTRAAVVGGASKSVIASLSSIPAVGSGPPEGVIAFLIDEGELARLLKDTAYQGAGRVTVSGFDGQIYADINVGTRSEAPRPVKERASRPEGVSRETIDGKRTLVISSTGRAGWRYTAYIPERVLSSRVAPIRAATIAYVALALVVGLALSAAFASKNSAPIADVSQAVQEFLGGKSTGSADADAVPGGVRKIIADAHAMETELERREAAFRDVAIERLLNGEYQDGDRSQSLLEHMGLATPSSSFVAIVARIEADDASPSENDPPRLSDARAALEEATRCELPGLVTYPVDEREIGLIATLPQSREDSSLDHAVDSLERIVATLPRGLAARTRFGLGSVRSDAFELHRSFREARRAVRFKGRGEAQRIVRYDETGVAASASFYPLELEARLVNRTKAGDRDGTIGLLDSVRDANFSVRLPDGQAELLVADMRSTFGKILGDAPRGAAQSFPGWDSGGGEPEDEFQVLRGYFLALCDAYGEERGRKSDKAAQRIIAWTQARYGDKSLGVASAAEAFELSESRFSQVFKEATGTTYAAFLEGVRIDKAREMLAGKRAKVDEVALSVGYANSCSFRRAFKRVTGVSPSEYA